MSNVNILPSSQAAVVGVIDPDANAAAAYSTVWIPMIDFEAIQAIIMAGTMATSSTLDAKLQQATSAAGAGAKDITGKAITQLTEAGTDSDKQAVINCRADELDVDGGFTHVRLTMTVAAAASDSAAIVLGHYPHYGPASDKDLASVDEIVA
ncbi:MAG: hypothetical protein ACTSWM_10050 [Alphaproteobacteria bacterium]